MLPEPAADHAENGVRGDLLSCYTSAVSVLLDALGLPHRILVGAQAALAVRRQGEVLEVVHQHTPLTGDGLLLDLPLRRAGAASAVEAGARVAVAAQRWGAVVVAGDTSVLPWVTGEAGTSEPHWFTVRSRQDGLLVDDVFRWSDDAGEHTAHRAMVTADALGPLALSPDPGTPEIASRESLALGRRLARPAGAEHRWQWLEAQGRPVQRVPDAELLTEMLHRVAASPVPRGVAGEPGWLVGAGAFAEIAGVLAERGRSPEGYALNKDLWACLRSRLLFQDLLCHEGRRLEPRLGDLSLWMDEELLPRWRTVIRSLRYSALRAERGFAPQASLFHALDRISALEAQLRDRLSDALAGSATSSIPTLRRPA